MRGSSFFVYLVVFTTIVNGSPHLRLTRPIGYGKRNEIIESRASRDPACPSNYLCGQDQCSSDIKCPQGTVCINLEGSLACAPPGRQWCALNPNTLEAVSCAVDELCCHGNCYTGNAICCNNPGTICTIGNLCGACNPGQSCGNNGACIGSNPTTTSKSTTSSKPPPVTLSTTSKTVPIPNPPTVTTTTTTTTTSKSLPSTSSSTATTTTTTSKDIPIPEPPTKTTTSTTTTTTTTKAEVPTPTIVQSLDPWEAPRCLVDSTTKRVLLNGTTTYHGPNGMTVKKCLEKAEGWPFVGLEYGGECFWGDRIAVNEQRPLSDCNMACDGNPLQVCGGGNRILVYENLDWKLMTRKELADSTEEYEKLTEEFRDAVQEWKDLVVEYDNEEKNNPSPARSTDLVNDLAERIPGAILAAVVQAAGRVSSLAALRQARVMALRVLYRAAYHGGIIALRTLNSFLQLSVAIIAELASLTSLAVNVLVNIATVAARAIMVSDLAESILAFGLAAVGGFLGWIFGIVQDLLTPQDQPGSPGEDEEEDEGKLTSYIVTSRDGTSDSRFRLWILKYELLIGRYIKYTDMKYHIYVTSMNITTAMRAARDEIVYSFEYSDAPPVQWGEIPPDPRRLNTTFHTPLVKRDDSPHIKRDVSANPPPPFSIQPLGTTFPNLFAQRPSPEHLRMLSDPCGNTKEISYAFRENPGESVTIYVADTGANERHLVGFPSSLEDTSTTADHVLKDLRDIPVTTLFSVPDSHLGKKAHGTRMCSLAGGKYSGSSKKANVISVEAAYERADGSWQGSFDLLVDTWALVISDVIAKGIQRKAVLSLSFYWVKTSLTPPWLVEWNRVEDSAWNRMLRDAFGAGIVVVCASGNEDYRDPNHDVNHYMPAIYADAAYYPDELIVIGAYNWATNAKSTFNQADSGNLITAFTSGEDILAASTTDPDDDAWGIGSGTSDATAITSGLIAYFLGQAQWAGRLAVGGQTKIAENARNLLLDLSIVTSSGVKVINNRELESYSSLLC